MLTCSILLIDRKSTQNTDGSDEELSGGDNESIADLENDDEEGPSEIIPVTDPITKLPLTDPIRNKFCNHVYGKASILAMLQGGNKTRWAWLNKV